MCLILSLHLLSQFLYLGGDTRAVMCILHFRSQLRARLEYSIHLCFMCLKSGRQRCVHLAELGHLRPQFLERALHLHLGSIEMCQPSVHIPFVSLDLLAVFMYDSVHTRLRSLHVLADRGDSYFHFMPAREHSVGCFS